MFSNEIKNIEYLLEEGYMFTDESFAGNPILGKGNDMIIIQLVEPNKYKTVISYNVESLKTDLESL